MPPIYGGGSNGGARVYRLHLLWQLIAHTYTHTRAHAANARGAC